MVSEAQRLQTLVLELLDAARAERGQLVGDRTPVDLAELAAESCARLTSDRHHCRLDAPAPVVGAYDRNRVTQLLDNLAENAVKYSPAGGEVTLRVWAEDGVARMEVADQGIGVPVADLPFIFDRFFRANNVDDRRFMGMGLGLYICKAIVEQHGGRIWASPRDGGGTVFDVELPIGLPVEPRND